MKCIERDISSPFIELLSKFPLVFMTGLRQSGKTSILKNLLAENYEYVNLEEDHACDFARNDPKGFINTFKKCAIIDDFHKAPALIPYIKNKIDEKGTNGLYVLAGSLDSSLKKEISKLLSGRAVKLTVLPFSIPELKRAGKAPDTINEWMFGGSYPELLLSGIDQNEFFNGYIANFMEHEIRKEAKIHGKNKFVRFLAIVAENSGVPLNLSRLGEETSIDARTVSSWISILEESHILFKLAPYRGLGKRYTKTPKLYFHDTGFLCFLLGLKNSEEINFHKMRNQIFETAVISEIRKKHFNAGYRPRIFYWRDLDNSEKEIDLIEESNNRLKLTEIKLSETANGEFTKNLADFPALLDTLNLRRIISKQVIYTGNENTAFGNIPYLNWKFLDE